MSDVATLSSDRPFVSFEFIRPGPGSAWRLCEIKGNAQAQSWSVTPRTGDLEAGLLHETLSVFLCKTLNSFKVPGIQIMADTVVTLPGLVLSGLRLTGRETEDGQHSVVARFSDVVGNGHAVLGSHLDMTSLRDAREELATRVVADLVRPCLDLAELRDTELRGANRDVIAARLQALDETRAELSMLADLLRRCITTTETTTQVAQFSQTRAVMGHGG